MQFSDEELTIIHWAVIYMLDSLEVNIATLEDTKDYKLSEAMRERLRALNHIDVKLFMRDN